MFEKEDGIDEMVNWLMDNITEMSFNDQMKLLKAYMSVIDLTKELYEKYNRPKPNRYFFMP